MPVHQSQGINRSSRFKADLPISALVRSTACLPWFMSSPFFRRVVHNFSVDIVDNFFAIAGEREKALAALCTVLDPDCCR